MLKLAPETLQYFAVLQVTTPHRLKYVNGTCGTEIIYFYTLKANIDLFLLTWINGSYTLCIIYIEPSQQIDFSDWMLHAFRYNTHLNLFQVTIAPTVWQHL